jgi:hypothetical protein
MGRERGSVVERGGRGKRDDLDHRFFLGREGRDKDTRVWVSPGGQDVGEWARR